MSLIIASRHHLTAPTATTSSLDVVAMRTGDKPVAQSMRETRDGRIITGSTRADISLTPAQSTAIDDAVRASRLLDVASVPAPGGGATIKFEDPTSEPGGYAIRIDDQAWSSSATPDANPALRQVYDAIAGIVGLTPG